MKKETAISIARKSSATVVGIDYYEGMMKYGQGGFYFYFIGREFGEDLVAFPFSNYEGQSELNLASFRTATKAVIKFVKGRGWDRQQIYKLCLRFLRIVGNNTKSEFQKTIISETCFLHNVGNGWEMQAVENIFHSNFALEDKPIQSRYWFLVYVYANIFNNKNLKTFAARCKQKYQLTGGATPLGTDIKIILLLEEIWK